MLNGEGNEKGKKKKKQQQQQQQNKVKQNNRSKAKKWKKKNFPLTADVFCSCFPLLVTRFIQEMSHE